MDNAWLFPTLLAVLFVGTVLMAFQFIRRAIHNWGNADYADFRSVLFLQRNYDKIRKGTRIPCSILYLRITVMPETVGQSRQSEAVRRHTEEILLAAFESRKSYLARYAGCDFVVLTRLSETQLALRVGQIQHELLLFSKANAAFPSASVCVGAYLIPASSLEFDEAIARAELACARAHQLKVPYLAWDYNLQRDYDSRKELTQSLEGGVENNNFFLEFQPIMDITTGTVVSGEVLTRLSHNRQVVLPADFVPVLRGQELSEEFDFYVLEKVCQWAAAHPETCAALERLSVNFSRKTIAHPSFAITVTDLLQRYGVPLSFLALEVLEDACDEPEAPNQIRENLVQLHQCGVQILLDDFGDGSSSFDDLQRYPVDIIKISKTIVANTNTPIGRRIFHSILDFAGSVPATVICEGVETPEQLEILLRNHCRFVQGFYFYRPMSAAQFERVVQNNRFSSRPTVPSSNTPASD